MRISDWSSDVCSSDLLENVNVLLLRAQALLSDGNLKNVEQLIGNLAENSGAIADNRGNVEKLIADAELTMDNLRQATGDMESMAASLQTNVEPLTPHADDTLVAFETMDRRLTTEDSRVGQNGAKTSRNRRA